MRILHVMNESLPNIRGYTIRAKYLLEAQADAGHEVYVLTSPNQGTHSQDESISGISYFRSCYSPMEKRMLGLGGKQLVFGRAISRRLKELLHNNQIDIIHAHTPFTVALPALKVARRFKLPFIYEKRNLWEESAKARGKLSGRWPFYQLSKAVDRYVTRSADAVCVITESLRNHTIKMGVNPDKIIVIKNGVDTKKFVPQEPPQELREQCLQGGSMVIGFVGSFFKFEGLPLLVESFADLVQKYPYIRLVLVGDGEDIGKVKHTIQQRGIQYKVWITGKVDHEKVRNLYSAIDVLVYPRLLSHLTDLISPLKPLEPMAMGKCVIGSNVGGIRALVRDGETGILFEAGSRSDLSYKLELIINRNIDWEALARNAREDVEKNHQWHIIAQQYEKAYRFPTK